ncbi:MAG: replication initiator protein A [Planctomycetaceae bacterium]|nr:replication initiator protein A [Planctomycetaceae bacterium]
MSHIPTATGHDTAFHGRDELNLIDFPIAVLRHQQPKLKEGPPPDELVCEIEGFDRDLKKIVPRKLTRRTASKYGFPTPSEDEVLIGLLTLTRLKNGFSSPRVNFQPGELFSLMGWQLSGTSNQRLSVALDRLQGLTLKYENAWTGEDGAFEKEFTTGLIESYKLVKRTQGRSKKPAPESFIQWASEVFSDIQRGNVRELNTDEFFALSLPLSRRMYRFLDKKLCEGPHFEMDLATFAQYLGLSETSHIGKIKSRLKPAIEELEHLPGFMEALSSKERFLKRGPGSWIIVFDRDSNAEAYQSTLSSPTEEPDAVIPDPASELVTAFYQAWNGSSHTPSQKELRSAREVLHTYGSDVATRLLPVVIKTMRTEFPDARSFGATMHFWATAAADQAKNQTMAQKESEEKKREEKSQRLRERDEKNRQMLREQWRSLPESQKTSIRAAVSKTASNTVREFLSHGKFDDPLVVLACFEEMKRRRETPSS